MSASVAAILGGLSALIFSFWIKGGVLSAFREAGIVTRNAVAVVHAIGQILTSSAGRATEDTRVPELRPRLPHASLSGLLVGLAVRRLPVEMDTAEKERWEREIRADVASVKGFLRRLRVAYRVWRKGASKLPVGTEGTARPARD